MKYRVLIEQDEDGVFVARGAVFAGLHFSGAGQGRRH